MLETHFTSLGFHPKETRVYLGLLELGEARASVLSRRCSLPRTTVYSILEGLQRRGLVSVEHRKRVAYFVANDPSSLKEMLAQERRHFESKERLVAELVEIVSPHFRGRTFNVPKMRFFEGQKSVNEMLFDRLPAWEQSMLREGKVLWGYQDHSFVQPYLPWLKWYWKRNEKLKVKIQLFSNQSDVESGLKDKVPLRTIRPFPTPYQFDSSIWVCGEYIVMLVTNQLPHFAFELRDSRFARSLRIVFQLLWSTRLVRG